MLLYDKPHAPSCQCLPCNVWLVKMAQKAVKQAQEEGTPEEDLEQRAFVLIIEARNRNPDYRSC